MRGIWKLRRNCRPLAVEFGCEVPVLGTVTCRLGELETAARRQREEEQAFGELLPSERTPGAVREASVSFFTSPSAAWTLRTTAQLGPPVWRPHHRDSGMSMGSSSSWQADRAKYQCWCHDRESDSSCFRYPSLYRMRRQLHPGSREAGQNPGARHSEHLVSSLLVCTL